MAEHLDFRGYFHMDELVRKTARELDLLGFKAEAHKPAVLQTSIGTKVGTWNAEVVGRKQPWDYVPMAGFVRGVLSQRPFGAYFPEIVIVSFAGEGYEDFRRNTGVPFFTTATVRILGHDPVPDLDYQTLDLNKVTSLRQKEHVFSAAYHEAYQRAHGEIQRTVQGLAARMRLGSFSRQCEYCKSMFVGEGSCPYCGGTATSPEKSIVADRVPSREDRSPFGR